MRDAFALLGASLLAASAAGQAAFTEFMPGDLGADLLIDEAIVGGSDLNVDNGVAVFAAWEVTGLFNPGDAVSLTGIVLPIWANSTPDDATQNTQNGTFTVEFWSIAGGSNPEQFDGSANESLIAQTDISFDLAGTGVFLAGAAFDAPINFTADASGFVFRVRSTGAFRLKNGPQPSSTRRINLTTGARVGNATAGNEYTSFTIAGTVVPAPASAAVLGLGGVLAAGRRRR